PPGKKYPMGEAPKPNVFKRAASAMGSAAKSMSNGFKGLFGNKNAGQDLSDYTPAPRPDAKPLDANFHVSLAELQERAGDLPGAEAEYLKALRLDGNHLPALLGYGRLRDSQE